MKKNKVQKKIIIIKEIPLKYVSGFIDGIHRLIRLECLKALGIKFSTQSVRYMLDIWITIANNKLKRCLTLKSANSLY